MNYKIVAILCDMDNLTLYKVPNELYSQIRLYLNDEPFPRFQKVYDALCKDEEDPKMRDFYDKIESCDKINDVQLIQVY